MEIEMQSEMDIGCAQGIETTLGFYVEGWPVQGKESGSYVFGCRSFRV